MKGIKKSAFLKGRLTMKHTLTISVSKKPRADSIVNFRSVSVREKFLRLLFGMPCKMTILVPGDSVEELSIHEVNEGAGIG